MDKEIVIPIISCQGSKQEHRLGSQTMKNFYFYYHPLFKQHVKAQTRNPGLPCAKLFIAIWKGVPNRTWVWQDEVRKKQEVFFTLLVLHSTQLKPTWPSGKDLLFKEKKKTPHPTVSTAIIFSIRHTSLPVRQITLYKPASHLINTPNFTFPNHKRQTQAFLSDKVQFRRVLFEWLTQSISFTLQYLPNIY